MKKYLNKLTALDWFAGILVSFLLAGLTLSFLSGKWAVELAGRITSYLTVTGLIFSYLVQRSESLYLKYTRWKNRISNKSVSIDWQAEFKGDLTREDLQKLISFLEEHFEASLVTNKPDEAVIDVGVQRLHINLTSTAGWKQEDYSAPQTADYVLTIDSGPNKVPFREAEREVTETIEELLEEIKSQFNSEWTKGTFTVDLSKHNPYWGLLVKKASPEVDSFGFQIVKEKARGRKDVVRVSKDEISIIAQTQRGFSNLAERYVALGTPEDG